MKRRRRPVPRKLLYMQARRLWTGGIIPPLSLVRAKDSIAWMGNQIFRIGYYGRTDGLDCVWLVNATGKYEGSWDQKDIETDFEVLQRSEETDWYGDNREILGPIDISEPLALDRA